MVLITRRKEHAVEMQICALVLRHWRGWILAIVKALHHGFGDSLKTCTLAEPVPTTLDLLNLKSKALTWCQGRLLCQVSIHSNQEFSLYHANMHKHTHTGTHDKLTAMSAPLYYIIGVDNNGGNKLKRNNVKLFSNNTETTFTCLNLAVLYHCCWSNSVPLCNQRMLYDTCNMTTTAARMSSTTK